MGLLDKVSKSFLAGLAIGLIICVIGLVIVLVIPDGDDDHHAIEQLNLPAEAPFRPLPPPQERFFGARDSKLGIYSKAAVSADAEPCAQVGIDIMKRDGTAVDAAIATLVCASVVHPHSHGIGGGFIMNIYRREEKKAYTMMARETAPAAAHKDMFVNAKKGTSQKTGLAIAVPGEVAGIYAAKKRFGNPALSMMDLLEPSIKKCEEGSPVTSTLAAAIKKSSKKFMPDKPEWVSTFTNPVTNTYYKEGDKLKLPKLGRTLRAIAADERSFYDGEIAMKLAEDLKADGSIITAEDLKNYEAKWDMPAQSFLPTKGLNVFSSPPPASGSIVNNILGTMAQFNHTAKDFNNAIAYQHFVEVCKFGFAKRTLMGDWNDPDMKDEIQMLVKELTSEDSARETRHNIRDDWTSQDPTFYGAEYETQTDAGTSHISVLGENGDAVAVTSTVNTYFGSGIVSPQTGVFFNNEMDDFSTPGLKNVYGIEPSEANYIKPGRRPVSSMSPTIVTDDKGDVKLVAGASGGPKIITGTAWVAMMHLFGELNIKEAIDSPRLHHQLLPMKVTYFPGFEPKVLEYLRSVGHVVEELPKTTRGSVVQGIAVPHEGIVTANNDWRKSGAVAGF